MKISGFVVHRKKTVIIIWVIVLLALTPLLLSYGQYISYSESPKSLTNSESGKAQQVLSTLAPSNSILTVVFQPGAGESIGKIEDQTLTFQRALNASGIPFYSGSSSAFSSYEKFLDGVLTNTTVLTIRDTYYNFSELSTQVYSFPSAFLGNWSQSAFSQSSINQTAAKAAYDGSDYESLFLKDLDQTYSASAPLTPTERVQNATATAAVPSFIDLSPFYIFAVVGTPGYNVTNYGTDLLAPVSTYLSEYAGFHISSLLVQSALVAGTNASKYYFAKYGLLGAPSFITQDYISPDNSTYLITVNFNVTEDFRGPNDFYPAQNATAELRDLSQKYLGAAQVTGQGAVAADTAQLSASSGYAFGLIFVFLAIAVGLLFAAYLPPIFVLIVVSLATALGYVSIFLTGVVLGHVDYVVTDVLTAVILGVSTDYFVFILARYREELRSGKTSFEALSVATDKAGFAVVVSGVTVAVSLGAISLVSGLESWGPVLLITMLLTVVLEVTLVPALLSLIGPRVFKGGRLSLGRGKRGPTVSPVVKPVRPMERSAFYRVVKVSERRKFLIIGVIVLLAVPTTYLWFNLPTTYNINEGLPQGLSSVQALNTIEQKFGSSIIYPTFVVVSFTQNASTVFGGLTPNATATLEADATLLLGTNGVKEVIGPTINGTKIEPSNLDGAFVFDHGSDAYFIVFTKYDPYSPNAISIVNQLRQNDQFLVGGLTSSIIDLQAYYNSAFQQLEIVILVVIAIVLGLSFRSAKYPFISLTGVFISITWTTAILYLISTYVLGQELVFLIPIVVYVILMSLGNDFAVFILSRVREEQKSHGFEEGLARAMVGSGAVVTALGLILAVSLGSLGLVPFGYLEQLGIAFVISLIVDTFVIRIFYFPSMILVLKGGGTEPSAAPRTAKQEG
ncbi:MAG: MMPL family transporter [Nitrososphaerales archaeon]|jgi:RND superfamily putative drug exporter